MITLELSGRIDSNNAAQVEAGLMEQLSGRDDTELVVNVAGLEYISSAGLRVLLRLRKAYPDMRIFNAGFEIYGILEMTGFTEMMPVERAYENVSIEGCEEIGRGANGIVFRLTQDTVVKVYNKNVALETIQNEREVAKLALILGIPTAISYNVVKVGDRYGSVYELLNARSFSKLIASEPEKLDWFVAEYVKMLKTIHGTVVPAGKLPDMKDTVISWASFMRDYLPPQAGEKLLNLVKDIPYDNHMIHGDYHTRNLQLQNDEVFLVDMDTMSVGNPIFELASIFNAFVGFYEVNHEAIKVFQGYDYETGRAFWQKALAAYLGTSCKSKLHEVETKARILGYTRLIRRSIRRNGLETEAGRAEIEHWKAELLELLEKTDTLLFDPDELEIDASDDNLNEVQAFVDEHLTAPGCSMKALMQIAVVVEEVFVNIAHYAYAPRTGLAKVRATVSENPRIVTITFADRGKPYNPLAKPDPDLSLPASRRAIGGLGILMTKKFMDHVTYEYRNGQNILTLKKNL